MIHAAGESVLSRVPSGTIAVALVCRDEAHLLEIAAQLEAAGLAHVVIRECNGEAMSIGLQPTTDRAAVRRVLSSLPLVGRRPRAELAQEAIPPPAP